MIKISKYINQIRRISLKGSKDQTTSHLTYYISVRIFLANYPSSVKEKKKKERKYYLVVLINIIIIIIIKNLNLKFLLLLLLTYSTIIKSLKKYYLMMLIKYYYFYYSYKKFKSKISITITYPVAPL